MANNPFSALDKNEQVYQNLRRQKKIDKLKEIKRRDNMLRLEKEKEKRAMLIKKRDENKKFNIVLKKLQRPAYKKKYSAKYLLTPREYKGYTESKIGIKRLNLQRRLKEQRDELKYRESQKAYEERTNAGMLGTQIAGVFRTVGQRKGITRALYRSSNQLPPQSMSDRYKTIQGTKSGRRGRPAGTYDQRYASYGGVYGFRKYQAQQYRLQRAEALRRAAVTPQQRVVLNQIEARDQARRNNPENRVIPDTNGEFNLNDIFREVNDASNIVG